MMAGCRDCAEGERQARENDYVWVCATHGVQRYTAGGDYGRVREFHLKFGHLVSDAPTLVSDEMGALRIRLIAEELAEYSEALFAGDLVEIADALGDLSYVVNGAALVHGIDLPAVVAEIHRSNMTKLGADGEPIRREDGKILKGPNFESPNLRPILGLDSA